MYGMFVGMNEDGQTVTSRIKSYDSYEQMVADAKPGFYGIVDNVVYHRNGTDWVVGFPNVVKEDDYSAYEVYANDVIIPVGESEVLGGYVSVQIPVGMTERLTIRTNTMDPSTSDVVIDWGDGSISTVSNEDYGSSSVDTGDQETNFTFEHTYASTGKYIVKIFGKDYYNFNHAGADDSNNLLCRIFAEDLPIASHIFSTTTTAYRSKRLLNVKIPSYTSFFYVTNWSNCFENCVNLLTATGFKRMTRDMVACPSVFANCKSMTVTDFRLPYFAESGFGNCYVGCSQLTLDISKLEPIVPFIKGQSLSVSRLFERCPKLTGTPDASKWWNNTDVVWKNTSTAFIGCSDEIRAKVPVSWGGTKEESI